MRARPLLWLLLGLLVLAGAWYFRPHPAKTPVKPSPVAKTAAPTPTAAAPAAPAVSKMLVASYTNSPKAGTVFAGTNKFAFRLRNTPKTIGQLAGDNHALLLENALIDTGHPLTFALPDHLRSQGDPGAYIVQANGPINAAFRAMLASAGAQIISYIPNDAYLVRIPQGGAEGLAANPLTQAVTPYEPYYKIQFSLLQPAVGQMDLPDGAALNLGLFSDNAAQTIAEITKLGGTILAQDTSPFGPVVRVLPPRDWTALATLPGVQIVEAYHPRIHANDLSRPATGVTADSIVPTNYMYLSGSNVMVEVNDSGIDATHPDFSNGGALSRIFGDAANLVDTDGHGTHVAGIIAGDGTESTTVTNAPGSILTNMVSGVPSGSPLQFRGKAPLAKLFSMNWGAGDQVMQAAAALTNALISNNSWNYGSDTIYDLGAASYDAAVRDSLPLVTGSQPVAYVFSAGNDGNGDDTSDPGGGVADTIMSPATAKNVITVGAIQEFRFITNSVETINSDGTTNNTTPWQAETSTGYRVAAFSARGNVGIGTEGIYGRFKPDVVAPGTFVVSTRSSQWAISNYFYINPTNDNFQTYSNLIVQPGSVWANIFPTIASNTVGLSIEVGGNPDSPSPFPNLPIYAGKYTSSGYDFMTTNNPLVIPGDPNATFGIPDILATEGFWGFNYAVSNSTTEPINFNVTTDIITTNNPGNYLLVLSNLDQSIGTANPSSTGPGPYYRYETGTSMSAADVSGVLALLGDYFTNQLALTPSPALLKAMVINGARPTGSSYDFGAQDPINYEGWGMVNLSNSLPAGVTTNVNNPSGESMLIIDQSLTNALATGDSHSYQLTLTNVATAVPLRITLAWTDPPGDPAAAVKLVNDLNLVVTNLSNPTNPIVYYGNDIPASSIYNNPENTNNPPVYDSINNVENVFLPANSGTNFAIAVIGYRVNVNAVTAHTNNVVQDYALVISSGNGEVTNAFTVNDTGSGYGFASNPTGDQDITTVITTNTPLLNQFVGANTPLLGTNQTAIGGAGLEWSGSNSVMTVGMTNQWHFYIVTNTGSAADFTNAAFITFLPDTLATPRMGVFAGSIANATRPEADIDLYVAGPNDPNAAALTNLDPTVISNCIFGNNGDAASLSRGGTEFVAYTNSVPGQVYYVGIHSQDQMASEYGFIPIFTDIPFSQPGPNGSEIVNGLNVPVNIPDGSPTHPGYSYTFALSLSPTTIKRVVVTNLYIGHQNYGDLIGKLTHGNGTGQSLGVVLNNHDSLYDVSGFYPRTYDDSGIGDFFGSVPSDGPGSLNSFIGQQAIGPWMLTEVDDSLTQTGAVLNFTMMIEPHQDLTKGIQVQLGPEGWFYDYVDVPIGATNLSLFGTNLTLNPLEVDMFVRYEALPTLTNSDATVGLTNQPPTPPGGSISIGPPLKPGRYWIGLYNTSSSSQTVYLLATLGLGTAPGQTVFTSSGPVPILDDAVTYATMLVATTNQVVSSVDVGLRVDHPRVSDLVFHLISPDGTRCLLVENRGGTTTNGMGVTYYTTNNFSASASGTASSSTNYVNVGAAFGSLVINYNFYTVPDEMTVYASTNPADFNTNILNTAFVYDTHMTNGSGQLNVSYSSPSEYLTIIMNQFGNTNGTGDAWDYNIGGVQTNHYYLVLTENTNLTTTPIKFAPVPFVPVATTNYVVFYGTNITVLSNSVAVSTFEAASPGDYTASVDGWSIASNQVSVINDSSLAYIGSTNFLALANSSISRTLPTIAGQNYTLTFAYRGPGAAGLWRGEGNYNDSIYGNNGTVPVGTVSFTNAEVGRGFYFNGGTNRLVVADTPILNFGSNADLSIDGWIGPLMPPPFETTGINAFVDKRYLPNSSVCQGYEFSLQNGLLYFHISDNVTVPGVRWIESGQDLRDGKMHFVAVSVKRNSTTGGHMYIDGAQVLQFDPTSVPGDLTPSPAQPLRIGNHADPSYTAFFNGRIDEVSIYRRALSDSEISAIYQRGSAGKYDTNAPTIALGLAEARVNLNGSSLPVFYGNNTNWQVMSINFTATSTGTPFSLTGLEPGMLVDSFALNSLTVSNQVYTGTNVEVTASDLYYFPEETLDTFQGMNASGTWQLEVQDDRAGAGLTNTLVSWQLRFNFTNTNATPAAVNTNLITTNFVTAGNINWYQITVPTNADFATNSLLFANGALNMWYSLNNPPTTTNLNDLEFLAGVTNGSVLLGATTTPPLVPGGTYYVGLQNTNNFTVTYGFAVDFHYTILQLLTTNLVGGGLGPIANDGTNLYVGGYLTNGAGYSILSVQMTNGFPQTLVYSNLANPAFGLAVNGVNLYWINPTNGGPATSTVFEGTTAGVMPFTATLNLSSIVNGDDLASDGTQLYAVDAVGGAVATVPFNLATDTLIGAARYTNLVADSVAAGNGMVYEAVSGLTNVVDPQVVSIPIAGTVFVTNYDGTPLISPAGIAVSGGALFVTDPGAGNTVWMLPASTNGSPTAVVTGPPFRVLNRITYLKHALYVTDNDNTGANGLIYQILLADVPPVIQGVSVGTNGVTLTWTAPIYDQFQVEWTTNLVPPVVWTTFPNTVISTTGTFIFTDTASPVTMKFYRLVEMP